MRETIRRCLLLFLLSIAALPVFGFEFKPMVFPSARVSALGGLHAALADDISVLFSNPAGFHAAGPQFSVAELTTNLSGPIFGIADLALRMVGGADPSALLDEPDVKKLLNSLSAGATLNGPIALGYIGEGLGFGIFNSSGFSFSTEGTVPNVSTELREDLLFVSGYGFRVPLPDRLHSTLDFGFSVRAFTRSSIAWTESVLSFMSLLSSPSLGSIVNQPFAVDVGFGIDTGALYNWEKLVSVGLVARNLYSPVARSSFSSVNAFQSGEAGYQSHGIAPLDISLGVLYTPAMPFLQDYLSSPKLMLDYSDMFDFWTHPDTASNPLLHIGLGAEVILLDKLAVRGGFGDGYFSAGLGLDLDLIHFDVSMFGQELSTEPGLRPSYNLILSTLFRY